MGFSWITWGSSRPSGAAPTDSVGESGARSPGKAFSIPSSSRTSAS
jgi:hypothetical protein